MAARDGCVLSGPEVTIEMPDAASQVSGLAEKGKSEKEFPPLKSFQTWQTRLP